MQQVLLACLLFVPQPFGCALMEAGKDFFEMERERNALHHILELGASKYFNCIAKTLCLALSFLRASYECLFYAVQKSSLESRVKELEEMLATRDAETEKVAKTAVVREKQFVDRVAFLAHNVQGKYSLCISVLSSYFV